jgi:hypothetical protein
MIGDCFEPHQAIVRGSWAFPVGVRELTTLVELVAWRIPILWVDVRHPLRVQLLIVDQVAIHQVDASPQQGVACREASEPR